MVHTRFAESDGTIQRARALRREPTAAEARFWSTVRGSRLGYKFCRQQRLGRYFVDFVCPSARLVIEIDGDTHADDRAALYDARRTAFLESEGYRVMRVSNADVMENIDGVAATVLARLGPSPSHSPTASGSLPLPRGERESRPHKTPLPLGEREGEGQATGAPE